MYVSDGYGQSRVHRMTAEGEVIRSWGEPGTGPGQFDLPHNVTVDASGRVLILDRGNSRCQVFNAQGEYLTEWGDLRSPNDMFIDGDGVMHIAEGAPDGGVCIMTSDGEVIGRWGDNGGHGLWIDSQGDLYFCMLDRGERLRKFARV